MVTNNCMHNHTNSYNEFFSNASLNSFLDKRKFTRPNINALIEKWIPSDMLWAPRFTSLKYVTRTRGSEEYISEIIESKEFWSTVMIP
jgi:hypothetical protein